MSRYHAFTQFWLRIFLVLVAVTFAYDIWYVVTREMDPNKHLPFFLPAVFGGFAAIFWQLGLEPDHKDSSDPLPPY